MKMNQLRAFLAIAESGNINRAADRLSLTQSAVSKSLRELEADLGVTLLTRTPHGMTLTEAGKLIADRAGLINAEVARARQDIACLKEKLSGVLTIGVTPVTGFPEIADAILGFRKSNPKVKIAVYEGRPSDLLKLMQDGTLDIAISTEVPPDSYGYTAIYLASVKTIISAHPKHPALKAQSIKELREYEWLTMDPIDDESSPFFQCFKAFDIPLPERVIRCASLRLCLDLARKSDAISIWAASAFHHDAVRSFLSPLPISNILPEFRVCLLSRNFDLLSQPARQFVKEIQPFFKKK